MIMNARTRKEVKHLLASAKRKPFALTEEMLVSLPPVVQHWLRQSNVIGREMPGVLRVRQEGKMRTSPVGKWLSLEAEQYFTFDPPAFLWDARIRLFPLLFIAGRDRYEHGKGNMRIRLMDILPLTNASGREIDQGSLVRFLAEISWFPQAAVSPYLQWEEINDRSARVSMTLGSTQATGVYSFDDAYRVSGFLAERYMESKGIYTKETWSVAVTGYKDFNGVPTGYRNEVTWKLKNGDFTWLVLEIKSVDEA
jgi:hypothetical protein